eukprot:6491484-Amphidinium_carterae.2
MRILPLSLSGSPREFSCNNKLKSIEAMHRAKIGWHVQKVQGSSCFTRPVFDGSFTFCRRSDACSPDFLHHTAAHTLQEQV